jgi:hypothetical protein
MMNHRAMTVMMMMKIERFLPRANRVHTAGDRNKKKKKNKKNVAANENLCSYYFFLVPSLFLSLYFSFLLSLSLSLSYPLTTTLICCTGRD